MPSSFVFPQLTVFNEFLQFPSALTDAMRAMIIGPQAQLTRYGTADEKSLALLGAYDPSTDHSYPYPNRVAGAIIDQAYTKVFVDDALLEYLDKEIGVQGTVIPVAGYSNRVRASGIAFKTNGTSWPRDPIFGDRDCQLGDVVDLRAVVSAITYNKRTTIAGFEAEVIASVIGAATAGADNDGAQSASATTTKVAGPSNRIVAAASATNYEGSQTGDVDETYTVEVTTGSVSGDLTTARLKVVSASGNDDYNPTNNDDTVGVEVSAVTVATILTPRGATITFTLNALLPTDSGFPTSDLIVGQKWTVVAHQAWTEPVATSGGTYTGTTDATYIITVQRGGPYAGCLGGAQGGPQAGLVGPITNTCPTIIVSTTTGIDTGGPYTVAAAGTAIPIGSQGVTISFSGTELSAGDQYFIAVTAATTGAYKTLILQDNMVDAMLPATDMVMHLYIPRQGLVLEQNRVSSPPNQNWTQDGSTITLFENALAYDASYTFSGVQQPLSLVEGQVYVQSRQWLQTLDAVIGHLSSLAEIREKLGVIDPDNPLAWGVNLAVLNASGSVVWYGGIGNPADPESWTLFLDAISNISGFYHLVPLTARADVLAAYATHIAAQSQPEVGAFRAGWFNLTSKTINPIVTAGTTTDQATAQATVTADVVTGLLTDLKVPAGNAKFVSVNKVKAGDQVRINFSQDGFGTVTYDTVLVASVINEDTLKLNTPVSAEITTPVKFEVWHPMSRADITADLVAQAATFATSRVRAVWPDQADGQPGYFLCAGLAGLASGIVIHQGMKNLQLVGFTTLQSLSLSLAAGNLQSLGTHGVWVLNTDPTGLVYSQAAVTTDPTSTLTSEEVINRNADAQAFYILSTTQQLIGVSNVVDGTVRLVRGAVQAAVNFIKTATTNAQRLGPPLVDATIVDLRQHSILKDRIVCTLQLALPYPFNQLVITIQVVA